MRKKTKRNGRKTYTGRPRLNKNKTRKNSKSTITKSTNCSRKKSDIRLSSFKTSPLWAVIGKDYATGLASKMQNGVELLC